MTTKKRHVGYFLLCLYAVIMVMIYILTFACDSGPYSFKGIYNFIYIILILPLFTIGYGVFAYKITKQIWMPALCLTTIFSMLILIFNAIIRDSGSDFVEELLELLPLSIIMFVISIISSLLTKFIVNIYSKRKKHLQ